MPPTYKIIFLSDLIAEGKTEQDSNCQKVLKYLSQRLDQLQSGQSEFGSKIRWIKSLIPFKLLIQVLQLFRYDALVGFDQDEANEIAIIGMISFQKHPKRKMIGMFDIYITPERRNRDISSHFQTLAQLVYEMTLQFKDSGYEYLQCGKNETTRKLLSLYEKIATRNSWNTQVDVAQSRIYLQHEEVYGPNQTNG